MSLRRYTGFSGNWQHVSGREFIHADRWPADNARKQFGLLRLEVCEQAENIKQVNQLERVLGALGRGLDLLQRGATPISQSVREQSAPGGSRLILSGGMPSSGEYKDSPAAARSFPVLAAAALSSCLRGPCAGPAVRLSDVTISVTEVC
jgi:hypothetical protein